MTCCVPSRIASFTVVVAFAIGARLAQADPSEPASIQYEAPRSCPTKATFVYEVGARTKKVRWTDAGPGVRAFLVHVVATERGFSGELRTREGGAWTAPRVVKGEDCAELVSALALMAAIAVDPDASVAPVAPAPLPAPEPVESTVAPARPPPVEVPIAPVEAETKPAARVLPSPRISVGVDALLVRGLAPETSPGFAIHGRWERPDEAGPWPLLQWSLTYADSEWMPSDERVMTARRLALRVDGCPLGWKPASWIAVHPCVAADAGVLHGEGRAVRRPFSESRVSASVGPALHLRIPFASDGYVNGSATAAVPVPRMRFTFVDPDQQAHQMPWLLWSFSLGAGWGW